MYNIYIYVWYDIISYYIILLHIILGYIIVYHKYIQIYPAVAVAVGGSCEVQAIVRTERDAGAQLADRLMWLWVT